MSDSPESGGFQLAASTSHLLHRAQQLAADRFALLVGADGVTLRQFAVLAAIWEAPGLSQTELVRATGIDRSTLADMMNRMEKRAWITRVQAENDARANAVRLAPTGNQVLAAARPHAKAADAAILDVLPKAKRRAFQNTLERLSRISDEMAREAERAQRRAEKRAERKQSKREAKAKREKKPAEAEQAPAPKAEKRKKSKNEDGPRKARTKI
jgi:MarR family transcriptional regulator, temperature-dependent positive regulator of motility